MPLPRLGPFELIEPIGRGGSGLVWRALHTEERVFAAVKVLQTMAEDSRAEDAFRAELASVAALSHPGIVMLFDHGTVPYDVASNDPDLVPGQPWLAMELASLGSLEHMIGWTWLDVVGMVQPLLQALAHAHARGIVHRDIKPSNILMAGPNDLRPGPKLSDFGIAHAIGAHAMGVIGTPRYMAPEQVRGAWRDLGPWTDLYALACVVWEMVTGAPPFQGTVPSELAHAHVYDTPPRFEPRFDVPDALESWLRRMLVKDPNHRFRRAAEAAWGLSRLGETRRRVAADTRRVVRRQSDMTLDGFLDTALFPELADQTSEPSEQEPSPAVAPMVVETPPLPADWRTIEPLESEPLPLHGTGLGLVGLRALGLVGRESEQDTLWRALRSAHRDRSVRVVVIQGSAGVGKSALARWLVERVHESGAAYPFEVHHEQGGGRHLGLVATVRRNFGLDGLSPDKATLRLRKYLNRRGDADADEARALCDMLLFDVAGPRAPDPRERLALLVKLLFLETRVRPVVLWIDDIPYGDASIEFVAHVLENNVAGPALFVLTARNDAMSEARDTRDRLSAILQHPNTSRMDLAPLTETDTVALVRRLLPLRASRARRVAKRVGGNPLFLVHLVADWVQRGLLRPTPQGWDLTDDAVPTLPDDLHGVWAERLERLLVGALDGARPALEVASALGASVDDVEWRETCRLAYVHVPTGLVARLVRERLATPTPEGWRFAHGMLRESIERVSREDGRWLTINQACATMLSSRRDLSAVTRRGAHLLRAGDADTAATVLLDVARLRILNEDTRQAERALELARAALARIKDVQRDVRSVRASLIAARIDKSRQALDLALVEARSAANAARQHGWAREEAEALAEQADIARVRGEVPEAWRLFQLSLALWARLEDDAGVADTLRNLSSVAIHMGDMAGAEAQLTEAQTRCERHGDRTGAALCRSGLGDIARMRGELDLAEAHYRGSLAVLRAEGHRGGIALGLHGLAEVNRYSGRLAEAEIGYQEVSRLDESLGRDASISRLNLALCRIAQERYAEALPELEALENAWRAQGRPGYLAVVYAASLPCRAALGDWDAWARCLAEAERLLTESAFVDIDVARQAEAAGVIAARAGRKEDAIRAMALARGQWQLLGQGAQVRALDEAIAAQR